LNPAVTAVDRACGTLVFIHGPPAAGKYTVGRELAARTGFELHHNHLVVDEVLARHAFGTPEFVAERDRRWRAHLGGALRRTPPARIIFTFNPENTVPQDFIDWLFSAAPAAGAALHSVALTAAEPALEARLATDQRRQFRKLVDADLYRRLRAAGTFLRPAIPRTDLTIDTGLTPPAEAAAVIARHFKLG